MSKPVSISVNGSERYRLLNIISNYLGYGLTPFLFFFLACSINPKLSLIKVFTVPVIYFIWVGVALIFFPKGGYGLFYVDENNLFKLDRFFLLGTILYFCSFLLLLIESFKIYIRYQYSNKPIMPLNFLLLIYGTFCMFKYTTAYISWLSIPIAIFVYYKFFNDLMNQVDKESELLNYPTFERRFYKVKKDAVLLTAKIEHFDKIKESLSSEEQGKILLTHANLFKKFFRKYGICYRLGEHEFCLICNNPKNDFDNLTLDYLKKVASCSVKIDNFPLVTAGYSYFTGNQNLNQVLQLCEESSSQFSKRRIQFIK
ncbi:MAG: diguanylate cyclase [Treponemataceae bacterium]|nr:diguanylate cyclase [Treponemataceae bacterium]